MEIKDQLRVRMEQLKISVGQLARDVGVSNQSVRHWLNGRSYPGKRHVPELEKRLSIKLDFSGGTHNDLPTAESTLQAQDIELFLKFSRLPPEVKMALVRLVDTILMTGSKVSIEEMGPVGSARHSPGRTTRVAAAR